MTFSKIKYGKRSICMGLAAVVLSGAMIGNGIFAKEPTFTDVPEKHWAFADVEYGAKNGYILGTGNGKFKPDNKLTFDEYATLVNRICFDGDATAVTDSTEPDAWYAPHKENLVRNGVMANVTDTGDNGTTRNEVAQLMYNCMKALGADETIGAFTKPVDWSSSVSLKYRTAVSWCYSNGLLQGDDNNRFKGESNLTRAEGATIVHRLVDAVAQLDSGSDPVTDPQTDPAPVTPPAEDDPVTPPVEDDPVVTQPEEEDSPLPEKPTAYAAIDFYSSKANNEWGSVAWTCTEEEFNTIKAKCEAAGLTLVDDGAGFFSVRSNGNTSKQAAIDKIIDEGYTNLIGKYREAEKKSWEEQWDGLYDVELESTYPAIPVSTVRMSKEELIAQFKSEYTDPVLDYFSIHYDGTGTLRKYPDYQCTELDKFGNLAELSCALRLYPESVVKTLSEKVSVEISVEEYNTRNTPHTKFDTNGYSTVCGCPRSTGICGYVHEFAHAMEYYVYQSFDVSAFENAYQNERQNALSHGLRDYADTDNAEFFACMVEEYIFQGDVDFCKTYAPQTTALIESCLKQCGATDADLAAIANHSHPVYYNLRISKAVYDESGNYLGTLDGNVLLRNLLIEDDAA